MQGLFQGITAVFAGISAMIGGLFGAPRTITIAPQSPAIVYGVFTPSSLDAQATVNATSSIIPTTTAQIATTSLTANFKIAAAATGTPGLLPKIKLGTVKTPTSLTSHVPTPKPTVTIATLTAPNTSVSATDLLNKTSIDFRATHDGPYELVLTTNAGGAPLIWNLTNTTIGGNDGVPPISVSYTCDTPPQMPLPDSADQNPLFAVHSSYNCNISFTPTTGNDQRTQSREFSFTTPSGQLIVMPPSAMDDILVNDTNNGGFVFDNQDASPVTITRLTFDVSYQYVVHGIGPLVLRLLDPTTEAPIGEYHLENLPADPTNQYAYHSADIELSPTIVIKGSSQKLLPIQILGVEKMLMSGTMPQITIKLMNVVDDRTDIKTALNTAAISWSCYTIIGGYDPNATSGPYASGQVCQN